MGRRRLQFSRAYDDYRTTERCSRQITKIDRIGMKGGTYTWCVVTLVYFMEYCLLWKWTSHYSTRYYHVCVLENEPFSMAYHLDIFFVCGPFIIVSFSFFSLSLSVLSRFSSFSCKRNRKSKNIFQRSQKTLLLLLPFSAFTAVTTSCYSSLDSVSRTDTPQMPTNQIKER